MNTALKYGLFAIISTAVNLFTQYFSLILFTHYGKLSLYMAMFLGTVTGLITKYILDKKYIFYYSTQSKTEDSTLFFLYSLMGLFTTLIFWGTEIAFDWLFQAGYAKYLGAVLGLSIGYIIKYTLDKRFVFKKTTP